MTLKSRLIIVNGFLARGGERQDYCKRHFACLNRTFMALWLLGRAKERMMKMEGANREIGVLGDQRRDLAL